jgi:hypothetical protein
MNVSREEAKAALDSIDAAGARVKTVRFYAEFAPFLLLWGVIWLVANAMSELRPAYANVAWTTGISIGFVITIALVIRNARRWRFMNPESRAEGRAIGRRAALLGITLWAYFPAMTQLLGPFTPRQTNAFISITWAFVYMITGAFMGWRIFAIGAVTAAAVLYGYLFIDAHFLLWMAFVGGGSLIAGGLWLRKI